MAILISLALRMLSSAFCAWAAGAIRAADRPAAANTPRVRRRVDEVTVRTVVIAGLLGRWMRRQGRLGQTLGGWNSWGQRGACARGLMGWLVQGSCAPAPVRRAGPPAGRCWPAGAGATAPCGCARTSA